MRSRRGSSLVEFTLVGVPILFLSTAVFEASLAMWQYYTMQHAIETADRYVATHGRGCTQNGNTCSLTVGNVASMIAYQAIAVDPTKMNVSLISATATTTCNPLNTCFSSTTQFPSSTDNGVNQDVTITATVSITNPLAMFWPGSGSVSAGTFTLGGKTRQRIQF